MSSLTTPSLCLEDILKASSRIAPFVSPTILLSMPKGGLLLKAESLQPIGAFKLRGAFNAILSLSDDQRRRGVVAHSSGNHAQAVAYVAHRLGIPAAVVMPGNVARVKLEAVKGWGAEVHLVDPAGKERASKCESLARERGLSIIEPYDSLAIMAGTGTIGLEILEQNRDVRNVFVPVSGGGLVGGMSAALKLSKPDIRVIGVEPELAADARASLRSKKIERVEPELTQRTIADGLRVPQLGALPFAHIMKFVDDIITVSEDQIRDAMRAIARRARLIAEPSGAVAIAGAFSMNCDTRETVAVLSGGNVDPEFFASVLTEQNCHDQDTKNTK